MTWIGSQSIWSTPLLCEKPNACGIEGVWDLPIHLPILGAHAGFNRGQLMRTPDGWLTNDAGCLDFVQVVTAQAF
jgi:hypothetical protein